MYELITASLERSDLTQLMAFPPVFMEPYEKEIVDWIFEYRKTHTVVPSLERLERQFSHFTAIRSAGTPLPIADIFQLELDAKKSAYTITEMDKIRNAIRDTGKVDEAAFNALLMTLTVNSNSISAYSSFDRDLYFRHGIPAKTRLAMIDKATKGVFPGEFFVIVARLGVGKSTLSQFFMRNWLMSDKRRILCVSKEMPPADVFARMDASIGHFNPLKLRDAAEEGTAAELRQNLMTVQHIVQRSGGEVFMPVMNVWSIPQIHTLAKNLAVDLVLIDGLYHLSSNTKHASMWEDVASVSRATKEMALGLNVPVFATTQLKRGSGKGTAVEVDDVAYSDAIAQDADFLAAATDAKIPEKKILDVSLIKNRYGDPITARVEVDYDTMRVIDTISTL